VIGTASGTPRVCFVASTTETVFIKVSQSDTGGRIYLLDAVETTLWANWFYIGASYSSFTLLRNTTGSAVDATITWRADSGTVVGSVSVAVPAYGVVFYDARFMTSGVRSGAGSVEVAHNGEPQAIVASQTTLSAATGLSFDTLFFQRNRR
jgi:hypothetical protein